ncbi:MAG: sodium:alanine symporter family protein [Candidatus Sulfobium sp.]|jgi:alanine or glycine:cation symporter, AGCS family
MDWLNALDGFMWGKYMMIALFSTGIVLTVRLRGVQFRKLGHALKLAFTGASFKARAEGEGDITPFQALMTTLASTVGNGNIAGVATAIALGGPGAPLWMWLTALIGMATRGTEAMLGVKYRRKADDGTMIGGAFYYLEEGASDYIGKGFGKVLAVAFAFAGMIAAFGIGCMVQSNSVALSVTTLFHIDSVTTANVVVGLILAGLTAVVILGGVKRLGVVAEWFVPFMALVYIGGGLIVILLRISALPRAIDLIFSSAFSGQAAAGGFAGAAVAQGIQFGVARGIFSNEAGLGTGSLAHSAAKTADPARQGLIGMTGTFIDTIVTCSITALAIVMTGAWKTGQTSTALTITAFSSVIGIFGGYIVTLGSALFGYSTILGWSYYGEQCTEYLFGSVTNLPYRALFVIATFLGAVAKLSFVWTLSDVLNGFMAIPNLVGLLVLSGVAARTLNNYVNSLAAEKVAVSGEQI